MAEQAAPPEVDTEGQNEGQDDERIPFSRFKEENARAQKAVAAREKAEKRAEELQRQLEDAKNAGLPEVEQLKKRLEQAEERAKEAEQRQQDADSRLQRTQKERWVTQAATQQNFADPSDASAFLNLDDIEDEKDAERAVKRLAGAKKHLLKGEDPKLPGRVLENGRRPQAGQIADPAEAQRQEEASVIWEGIQNLRRQWQSGGTL
jgi:hypothetical protein